MIRNSLFIIRISTNIIQFMCSLETAIQAIEAKLKLMKESEEEFELNKPLEGSPIIHLYQKAENQKPSTSTRYHSRGNYYHHNKPYSRHKPRR